MKEDPNTWNDTLHSQIGGFTIVKMSFLPKLLYSMNLIQKISAGNVLLPPKKPIIQIKNGRNLNRCFSKAL